ncbi:MAG: DUF1559 domain-containing protein [Planctomycetaceae bacterium]|nr:DUF1559 domain-containing protein [Planctomycetaceae bacterium]
MNSNRYPRQYSEYALSCELVILRRGFSIQELLVSIAIIAILLALILPAVQQARQAAHRAHCASNLRQLGVALHNYHDRYNLFPPGNINGISMFARILPDIEQTAIFSRIDFQDYDSPVNSDVRNTPIPLLHCPMDGVSVNTNKTNYVGNCGTGVQSNGQFLGMFGPIDGFGGQPIAAAEIVDGLSNTVAYSESLVSTDASPDEQREAPFRVVWRFGGAKDADLEDFLSACDALPTTADLSSIDRGRDWLSGNGAYTLYNHSQTPNRKSCSFQDSILFGSYVANSLHTGGVNIGLADGSVRFVGNDIDKDIWRASATRSGREGTEGF